MSRIRDIANLFSANTDAATDAEVTAAIASHNTTSNGHVKRGNTSSRPSPAVSGDVYANTQSGYLEYYNGTSWVAIGAVASTPTSVVATNQGSGRAYNNGSASVAFSPGDIVGSSYTITSSPGSYTASGISSPIIVTGLQSSTQYTYTATATNAFGTSSASSASTAVTATTVPQAPTINSVTAGDGQVEVAFTAGATGGSTITGYTVTSSPGNFTGTGSSSPITVTGLTNGTPYTFTVTATNANGTSEASSASSSISPVAATRALFAGGNTGSNSNTIDYVTVTTLGNATNFGTLSTAKDEGAGNISSSTRGVFGTSGTTGGNIYDYVTIATTGNALFFGNGQSEWQYEGAGLSNSTRGLVGGGRQSSPYIDIHTRINYITIATTGNSTSFGDMSTGVRYGTGLASTTRGIFSGGYRNDGSNSRNDIQYVTIATTGNSTSFGTLTQDRYAVGSCANNTRGVIAGGLNDSNSRTATIEYITIASTGNGTSFGNLTDIAHGNSGTSSSTRGLFHLGYIGTSTGARTTKVNYIEIATTGNASNFGDLTVARHNTMALSSGHGGI